jgi:ParB-like chromosome segregation protein Spo0J
VVDRSADPYAKNARTHTDAQIAAIAASIKEWGWTTPALVGEDGGLIAGHASYSPLGSSASPRSR